VSSAVASASIARSATGPYGSPRAAPPVAGTAKARGYSAANWPVAETAITSPSGVHPATWVLGSFQ
jgi:hypothetical protein